MTFAADIEEAAHGEPIEAIVIGRFGWASDGEPDSEAYGFDRSDRQPVPETLKNVVLTWDEAREHLDYEYDTGYGAPDCHNIVAWTASRVLTIHEYDGSTSVKSTPRNPTTLALKGWEM